MIETLLRESVKKLVPYSSARGEFKGRAAVFLDANENGEGSPVLMPYVENLERYPDPLQVKVKEKVSAQRHIEVERIFVGNGSDEGIDLLFRAVCEPGKDSILIADPTYPMYEVQAAIHGVEVHRVRLTDAFALDAEALLRAVTPSTKVIFICSPNNPSGNVMSRVSVEAILSKFSGLVVIDEAYIEFADGHSWLPNLSKYENLVILQTLSKAYGLAGARVGFLFADPRLIAALNKIKSPYNLSSLAQQVALEALSNSEKVKESVAKILSERDRLVEALSNIAQVQKVFPSDSNFLLVKFADGRRIVSELRGKGIIVRDRSALPGCENCVRITVGSHAENNQLLAALGGADIEYSERNASKRRATKETDIRVSISLDGSGKAQVQTGLGFFDHMLEQISKHSGMDLVVAARGDLQIDEHHTIEDTAIAMGATLKEALGEKRGIERYGFVLPMDEARATVALDLSGRSYLVWNVTFSRERVGDFPTELAQHFFRSLVDAAGITLHVDAIGDNDHHIIESIFKGFARALRMAIEKRGSFDLPSTKGTL